MKTFLMSAFVLGAVALGGCGDDSADVDMSSVIHDLSATGGDMAKLQDLTFSPDAAGMVTLHIENYLAWCTVSANGAATSAASTQDIKVSTGSVVNLVGDTASASSFVWGYWRNTAGDTSGTHDTAKTTTVTVTANKTIQACCPLTSSPTTPCPNPT